MVEETLLHKEIYEQPEVLERLLGEAQEPCRELARAIRSRGVTHVTIAARGTSDNAGRYAKYVLGSFNGLPVGLATPSLFSIYGQPTRMESSLVLGISQSGQSPDIIAVLAEARRQGALTAVITNTPASPLAAEADVLIDLGAGEELAVAATKTYTAELAAIGLLSAHLAEDAGLLEALASTPEAVAKTLAMEPSVAEIAPRYRYMERSVVIGRGYNYATAFEMALKIKELTYTIVEPYSSADFLHGPLAMIEHGFPVVVIAPSGMIQDEMQGFIRTLKEQEAEVIVISDLEQALAAARIPLALPHSLPEWLSPLTTIVPGQLFAMHLAAVRDYNVDQPRSLRKVTETR